ncbi:TOBE domain-containing protein [Parasporobacterium paucivorans]|uniref:Molybdenum-pterin binding domain-containing protein n=1 Tax=Parasporobacterium paucivorans DSM 15970 TaxID=1122934 RepID=A0A1M6C9V0_9FIRM|nr:TOBE domain-containing protein [Parasporobacterium paucivorans]SHI57817.1 molybdenum-pterin binding domain-containing protein [Parasporobacterium paucivorans DSM 15970]
MKLSARNQIKGRIVRIDKGQVNCTVALDIGGGNIVTATISRSSVEELALHPGMDAYAIIKATSVMIGVDE